MPIRIVTTHLEFEGEVQEQRVVIEGEEPPTWDDTAELRIVGQPAQRVDALAKVTGSAVYTADVQLPGMLHAAALRSPHPHAHIRSVDTREAERMPGIRAIFHAFNAGDLKSGTGAPIFAPELLFAGQEVALVVAETAAQAAAAVARIQVEYETLPFVTDPQAALAPGAPHVASSDESNGIPPDWPKTYARGDVERGLADADTRITVRVTTPTALHNSMETHGSVARWDGQMLTLWCSTQAIYTSRDQIAQALGLARNQVEVITEYMGGGFGSKLGVHKSGIIAAYAARRLGQPVKFMLPRTAENLDAGNRPASVQSYRLGARRDGTLTAVDLEAISNVGAQGRWFSPVGLPTKELYQCDNVRVVEKPARTNLGTQSSFRAPGAVEGTFGLEVAMDELARRLGMDPLELRRTNDARRYQLLDRPYARKLLLKAYDLGSTRIGWAGRDDERRRYPRGRAGTLRRGVGMASQVWGGDGGPPAQAQIKLLPDGSVVVVTGTQDIGTGTRTALAQIAAEELCLPMDRVRVDLGNTAHGVYSPASGGSMTLASVGPAVRMAAADARTQLLEIVGQLAEAPADALEVRDGKVFARDTGRELGTVGSFLGQLDGHEVTGKGMRGPNAEDVAVRAFGVQFAEVEVDIATGAVRVLRMVAVHDCGRIINPLTYSSQIEGGIIQGVGFALMEDRVVDERLGTVLNANLEGYKVPTIRDVPEIDVVLLDEPLVAANTLGSLGAGEPPIIPTAGAIANAVAHAIDRSVTALPLTPSRVLDLLR